MTGLNRVFSKKKALEKQISVLKFGDFDRVAYIWVLEIREKSGLQKGSSLDIILEKRVVA